MNENNNAVQAPQQLLVNGPQVIDNGDFGFGTVGSWSPYANEGYQNDIHFSAAGAGADVASWTFAVTPGRYRVSAAWHPLANRASNAPFTVLDGSTPLATLTINQEAAPNDFADAGVWWEDLGGPYSINSNTLVVRLSDLANEYVIADAIRVERLGNLLQVFGSPADATRSGSQPPAPANRPIALPAAVGSLFRGLLDKSDAPEPKAPQGSAAPELSSGRAAGWPPVMRSQSGSAAAVDQYFSRGDWLVRRAEEHPLFAWPVEWFELLVPGRPVRPW